MKRFLTLAAVAALITAGVAVLYFNDAEAHHCDPPYETFCYQHGGYTYCDCR